MAQDARAPWVWLAALGLACSSKPPLEPETEDGPRLYLSVASTEDGGNFAKQLTIFEIGEDHIRAAVVLEAGLEGFVRHVTNGRSPSGRYGLYSRVRDDEDPSSFELHLIDFERDPLGSPRRLTMSSLYTAARWSADESLLALSSYGPDGWSLWTLPLGDESPQAISRIPIDVAPNIELGAVMFSPAGRWLYFAAGTGTADRLFGVRFEDRTPVQITEIREPELPADGPGRLFIPLWVDDEGRGLIQRRLEDGRDQLESFDLSQGPSPAALAAPSEAINASAWLIHDNARGPQQLDAWTSRLSSEQGYTLIDWIRVEWTDASPTAAAPVRVDAWVDNWGEERRVVIGDELYFIGETFADPNDPDDVPVAGLLHVRAGESEAQPVWPVAAVWELEGLETNAERSLLALHGPMGVVVFELGPEGPGPAQLASPTNYGLWGLYDQRFVQALTSGAGSGVRVADFGGAGPSTIWDLAAIAPLAALPSPIDSRVFVLDDGELWIDDPLAPGMRVPIEIPSDHDTMIYDAGLGQWLGFVSVREAVVHAPGVASYAP